MLEKFLKSSGIYQLVTGEDGVFTSSDWVTIVQYLAMYVIIGTLFYLAIVKKFEPLLLLPIAFGMLLANLPGANLIHLDFFFDDYYLNPANGTLVNDLALWFEESGISFNFTVADGVYTAVDNSWTYKDGAYTFAPDFIAALQNNLSGTLANIVKFSDGSIHVKMSSVIKEVINNGGLIDILYLGVKLGVYPSLIFLGVGAMTDFTPLIANPKSLFMGAGAQFGVFAAFFGALLLGFSPLESSAIGIIGGADGPTAILVTKTLAPQLLGAIAIAAYSYMALIPIIQPPFMKLLTTKKERQIKMTNLRSVSKVEKVIFPIVVTAIVCFIVPDAAPLVGFLMFGNLLNVSGVTERLSKTSQNELCNIVTICLGVSVGATANAQDFLSLDTIKIIVLGLTAFILSTIGGLLTGKVMCKLTRGKINPLIGAAGVSAVPMAARVAQDVGRKEDPSNFLLMHAMGPNVAGVLGSAVAAGVFLNLFA